MKTKTEMEYNFKILKVLVITEIIKKSKSHDGKLKWKHRKKI